MIELTLMCNYWIKMLGPVRIPLLKRLKHGAINSILLSRYSLGEKTPVRPGDQLSITHPARMPDGLVW